MVLTALVLCMVLLRKRRCYGGVVLSLVMRVLMKLVPLSLLVRIGKMVDVRLGSVCNLWLMRVSVLVKCFLVNSSEVT